MSVSDFPLLNASLNGVSAVLLLLAYGFLKARRYAMHAGLMIAALVSSSVFLACYLTYHTILVRRGVTVTHFPPSAIRPYYLAMLISHTILAAAIVPLIFVTFWYAVRRRWARHRRFSVWTFPLWLYVSVTGVLIYWMLYHVAPGLAKPLTHVP